MIRKAFLEKIFEAASRRRWNDKIVPVELKELDKQAHKMIIAFVIGKYSENEPDFNWVSIIEGGLFEFLQRLVITDLKPQIFAQIKKDYNTYNKLNRWVFEKLEPILKPIGNGFFDRFQNYFQNNNEDINKKILHAAHFYATTWEFDIVERTNPTGYEIPKIKKLLNGELEKDFDLEGMKKLIMYSNLKSFVDLCGQLRFQLRWSHIQTSPRTSVLGHMLIVAMLAYLSLEKKACKKMCINNYFTGLFHDLPEVLTRDIISPVKRSVQGLEEMIKEYEIKQMNDEVYVLLPKEWHKQIRIFTEIEFESIIVKDGKQLKTKSEELYKLYNKDSFNPRDGELVKAVDHLAAFIEAYTSLRNGIDSSSLKEALCNFYLKYKDGKVNIAGIDFGAIYQEFSTQHLIGFETNTPLHEAFLQTEK